jgi:hypothetical protein
MQFKFLLEAVKLSLRAEELVKHDAGRTRRQENSRESGEVEGKLENRSGTKMSSRLSEQADRSRTVTQFWLLLGGNQPSLRKSSFRIVIPGNT